MRKKFVDSLEKLFCAGSGWC